MKSAENKLAAPKSGGEFGVIKTARRVLELFEYFAECRRPLTVGDVVQGLDYPQSSVSALLKSLTKLGYLDYDRHKRTYVPTLRVALIGGWIHSELYTESSLFTLVESLHRSSNGMVVILAMQNDIYVQYVHVVQSPSPQIPWYVRPGALRPLCRSAVGQVLLSLKPDVEVQQLLPRINAEEEPAVRLTIHDLLKVLDLVRKRGYAFSRSPVNPHGGVIAVQMPTPPGQPPMAVGLGGPVPMLDENKEQLVEMLREAVAPYRIPKSDRRG